MLFPPTLRRQTRRRSPTGFIPTPCSNRKGRNRKIFKEAAKQLRPLLEETVRDHLIADVPLGVFLSSGLDSTSSGCACQPFPERPAHIYGCISRAAVQRSQDFARNGQAASKRAIRKYLLSPETLVAQLEDAVNSLDQPTMDGLNTYFVSRAAQPGRFESGSLGARQR